MYTHCAHVELKVDNNQNTIVNNAFYMFCE